MTDDERANRNPKPEIVSCPNIEIYPPVRASELKLHNIYVVQGQKHTATLNYMGSKLALDPITLDTVMCHHFYGPRVNINAFLRAKEDGTFTDAEGTRIIVRRYHEDAL